LTGPDVYSDVAGGPDRFPGSVDYANVLAYHLDHRSVTAALPEHVGGGVVNKRWTRLGILALGIFAVNAIARFITWKFKIAEESSQLTIGFIAVVVVGVGLAVAGAWWAVRYPFSRLFADLGAAVGGGALLSLFIGPFAGGGKPFAEGLGFFVGQILMFLGVAGVGVGLGFLAMVAFGKDWKSRGLLRYELNYSKRPHRSVRS
jgi:hypothetical protein